MRGVDQHHAHAVELGCNHARYSNSPLSPTRALPYDPAAMHPMLNIAVAAARAAGSFIVRYLDRVDTLNVSSKHMNEFVTEVDREAEAIIIADIRKAYPDHAILAEESGAAGDGEYRWIIDPLDGTTNYVHGFPQFCVSIALEHRGRLDQGVVFDPAAPGAFHREPWCRRTSR